MSQKTSIKKAIADILWMARRYADNRRTYAPRMFNDAYDILRTEFGDDIDPKNASDMQGNKYHDITLEHTKSNPYARDHYDNISGRKFYPKEVSNAKD